MTLDEICKRPGAGAALLHLHRWLPQHGAFAIKRAFHGCAIQNRLTAAGADLTAFTLLATLGRIIGDEPVAQEWADRALMMLSQADGFDLVREFVAMEAALDLADARSIAEGRGGLRRAFSATEAYLWALQQFALAVGLPLEVTATRRDGTPVDGGLQ
jgi:hypothetical protein